MFHRSRGSVSFSERLRNISAVNFSLKKCQNLNFLNGAIKMQTESDILKDQHLQVKETLMRVTLDDVAELRLTKGQNKLLSKAVSELKAPDLPPKLTDPKPITTTSLAKD